MGETIGAAVRRLRQAANLSLRETAKRVPCSHGHLGDIESGRRTPDAATLRAIDEAVGAGGALAGMTPDLSFAVRSHKFVVNYVEDVRALLELSGLREDDCALARRWSVPVDRAGAENATMYVWEHGTVIHHVVEERAFLDLTELALWRYRTYEQNMPWAAASVGADPAATYVLSAYWLSGPPWPADQLDAAVRLAAMPRALVGLDPARPSDDVEGRLLRTGLDSPGLTPFGVPGTSIGYASWSGVAYLPLDPARGLTEAEVVEFELQVQGLWGFCSWLDRQVQAGNRPRIPGGYGWAWLRSARSKLTAPRATESGPHRMMREAVLTTSGLPAMLNEAIATLRETA